MATNKNQQRASLGALFWIAFILLVLVVFLANRTTIRSVLESTGLVEILSDRFGVTERDPEVVSPTDSDLPDEVITRLSPDHDTDGSVEDVVEIPPRTVSPPTTETPRPEPRERIVEPPSPPQPVAPTPEPTVPAPSSPRMRETAVYFIRVTDDGRINAVRVIRRVEHNNAPMTETLKTLLKGPTLAELGDGLLNLIPENTRLHSATVQDGVAYLNFNEAFQFNPMGAEGLFAQLQQVIYSTTEFPTVEKVQILIDGKKIQYLGGDGIFIGTPIGREAFG